MPTVSRAWSSAGSSRASAERRRSANAASVVGRSATARPSPVVPTTGTPSCAAASSRTERAASRRSGRPGNSATATASGAAPDAPA